MQATLEVSLPAAACEDVNALFHELMQQHKVRLYRFVLRYIGNAADAEDLAQQAFIDAAQTLHRFRGEAQLSTWLYGIAMNLVRNHLSRAPHRVHRFVDESALTDLASATAGPEQQFETQQLLALLDAELSELPPEVREALLLVALDELTYEEAAALLAVPIGTVRSRISRARVRLRKRFEAAGVPAFSAG